MTTSMLDTPVAVAGAELPMPINKPLPWDIETIHAMLPHRYPFLLVDRITALDPEKRIIEGYKLVSANEPFFQGHFPGRPVMPGVLQIEALAQLGCVLTQAMIYPEVKLGVLAGVDNFRFRRLVIPGDRLDLYGEIIKFKSGVGKAICRASVNGETSAEGEIMFSLIK
ncbi:MAG: 3-hydroxyacyl-ACP dehydratase FabZ [Vampirovibrionales bacterium]|nr:3-hydroxyacyl-ACP dehydratase FabZ [Vampirovibrionales bacterium]